MNVIDFTKYLETKRIREFALAQLREAELAQQARLEVVLTDLLAELEVA